jgi:hypothetical protein
MYWNFVLLWVLRKWKINYICYSYYWFVKCYEATTYVHISFDFCNLFFENINYKIKKLILSLTNTKHFKVELQTFSFSTFKMPPHPPVCRAR